MALIAIPKVPRTKMMTTKGMSLAVTALYMMAPCRTEMRIYMIIFARFVKKYKLVSRVVHSHINDPFGPVGIVAFGGSPFETLAHE